ncbi:MAG: sulfotransferase [Pseudomonadota bacterium]
MKDEVFAPQRTIFVGGPGRSGTSFVAERLGRHPEICSFQGIELKIFSEKNGLLDLRHALVERYSPNRAGVALDQFRKLFSALVGGQFGQPAFESLAPARAWHDLVDAFCAKVVDQGVPMKLDAAEFDDAARGLLIDLSNLAAGLKGMDSRPVAFLEKTPHSLLFMDVLGRVAPSPQFVHVMRDPRSIAFSLRRMPWGPQDLASCCAWVSGYCAAWLESQRRAASLGYKPIVITIESVAAAPEASGLAMCRRLGIETDKSVFAEADLKTLNAWIVDCPPGEIQQIRRTLDGWAHHFGYDAAEIGGPMSPSSSCIASDAVVAQGTP